MADPAQWRDLLDPVRPAWTPHRAELVAGAVARRVRRRTQLRVVAALGAAAVTALVVVTWRPQPQVAQAPRTLQLDDGTRIEPHDTASEILLQEMSPERRVVRLRNGGARFVVARAERPFRVETTAVTVEVLGTTFSVTEAGDRVGVRVESGRVRVAWPTGAVTLGPGEGGLYPPEELREQPPPAPPKAETREPRPPSQRWRALAQRGRFDEAYRALRSAGAGAVPDEPGALLMAADVARLSQHPAQAVSPLRTLVQRFPRDPRASLAAFTLGLVYLEELGRPREAAVAFARSRSLDPSGDLAEDALGREVEAHYRAGDAGQARERAEEYVRRFPSGRRVNAVRGYGGLR